MPTYVFEYFNLRARGELIRLIFAEAGEKYEDKRFSFEEWPKHKPNMPFGQVPVLMVDDKRLPQSGAIVRYLAKEFKLVGDNPLHAAFADMLFETLNEKLYKFPFVEKDEEKRAQGIKTALEESVYPTFNVIENRFKEKGGDYIITKDKLTYADLAIFHALDLVSVFDKDIGSKYPTLQSLADRVAARPNLKAYLDSRPTTPF